jgi:hypothetical protein
MRSVDFERKSVGSVVSDDLFRPSGTMMILY